MYIYKDRIQFHQIEDQVTHALHHGEVPVQRRAGKYGKVEKTGKHRFRFRVGLVFILRGQTSFFLLAVRVFELARANFVVTLLLKIKQQSFSLEDLNGGA